MIEIKNKVLIIAQIKWIGILFAILCLGIKAKGQQASFNELTLKEVLEIALKSNHEVNKSKLDIENSQYKINEVRSLSMPNINASGGLKHNPLLQQSALPGEFFGNPGTTTLVALGQEWNTNLGVNFSQILFNKTVFSGLKAAKTSREFLKLKSELTEEEIIEQVSTLYYAVLIQQQKIDIIDTTMMNTKSILDITVNQYENGLMKELDVRRLKVVISNLKSNRQQMENEFSILKNQLKLLSGIQLEENISLSDSVLSTQKKIEFIDSSQVSKMTEMKLIETQKQLLEVELESIRAGRYPTLTLNGNYSYQGLSNDFPYGSENTNWFDVASIGVNLRIPIFQGFYRNSKIQQSKIANQKINEDLETVADQLNLAKINAESQIDNSLITLNIQEENVQLAKEVADDIRRNYNDGLASLTDLISSETSLSESKNSYLMAVLTYKIAEIELVKVRGNLKSLIK